MGDDGCERWGWREGCDGIGVGRDAQPMGVKLNKIMREKAGVTSYRVTAVVC